MPWAAPTLAPASELTGIRIGYQDIDANQEIAIMSNTLLTMADAQSILEHPFLDKIVGRSATGEFIQKAPFAMGPGFRKPNRRIGGRK